MTARTGAQQGSLHRAGPGRIGVALLAISAVAMAAAASPRLDRASVAPRPDGTDPCPGPRVGITLSPGFCATIFADNLGHIRHLAVGPNGALYANTWSGRYFPDGGLPAGGFLVAMQDTNGDGRADVVVRFGQGPADGVAGGSGIAVYKDAVYAEVNDKIVRYPLGGAIVPAGGPQVVLSGLPLTGAHPMHPFVIDGRGQLFVDLGSATNACQAKDRAPGMAGMEPCPELPIRAGVWRYDANKLGQAFSPKERFVLGLRNGEGMAFDAAGRMFATQHGRDQLLQNWPSLYPDAARATELPAEELVELTPGADYGWPACYYDAFQKKRVLAPEYGGDGGVTAGICATKKDPIAAFPAHWGPNDLAIYNGQAFPAPYRGGAFIAFHGSWNRSPEPQGGYNVVFQPLRGGKASGPYIVFADGFAGALRDPGQAAFRPTGLAVGPDGALYIADDNRGRVWRVTYRGPRNPPAIAAAPTPLVAPPSRAAANGVALGAPPGSTATQVAAGAEVFHSAGCGGCHGLDGKGTPLASDLTSGAWVWGDGSLAAIRSTIVQGVASPKRYRSPMPPAGGAHLAPDDEAALAAYVWALGHRGGA